jgi:hypothetical protein
MENTIEIYQFLLHICIDIDNSIDQLKTAINYRGF